MPVTTLDGKVRICGDYKIISKPQHQAGCLSLTSVEEIFKKLLGGKIFFHAWPDTCLSTNATGRSLKRTRHDHHPLIQALPFSISAAPVIFQRTLETLLSDIPNVCIRLDDILASGKTTHAGPHSNLESSLHST